MKTVLAFYRDLLKDLREKWLTPQTTTNLNIKQWSRTRLISLGISCAIYLVLLSATLYSSIDFWSSHAKTPEVGAGFALLLDGLAMLCLIFRIARIQFPLNFLRHTLPLTTMIPVYLFSFYELDDVFMAAFTTGLILAFSFILQHHIESLFISPADLADEAIKYHARGLINEQLRRQAVDNVLYGFKEESKQIQEVAPVLSLPSVTGRDSFRIQFKIAHKHVTEAYKRYRAGENFDEFKNTSK